MKCKTRARTSEPTFANGESVPGESNFEHARQLSDEIKIESSRQEDECGKHGLTEVKPSEHGNKEESSQAPGFLDVFMHVDPSFESIDKFISDKLEKRYPLDAAQTARHLAMEIANNAESSGKSGNNVNHVKSNASQPGGDLNAILKHSGIQNAHTENVTDLTVILNKQLTMTLPVKTDDSNDVRKNHEDGIGPLTDLEETQDRPVIEIDVDISDNHTMYKSDFNFLKHYGVKEVSVPLNDLSHPKKKHSRKDTQSENDFVQSNSVETPLDKPNETAILDNGLGDTDILGDGGLSDSVSISSIDLQPGLTSNTSSDVVTDHARILGYSESETKCPACLKQFKTRKSMQNHKAKVHGNRVYHCDQCGKWFPTRLPFNDHIRMHLGIRPFKCSKCGKTFTSYRYLLHHSAIHTVDSEKKYSCSFCTKRFVRRRQFEAHERMHTQEKPYKCSDCPKAYRYEPQLRIHRRLHTGDKFYCDICKKGFVDKSDMKRHKETHSQDKKYRCDTCGASFKQKNTLRVHAFKHADTSQIKMKTCIECGMVFKLQSSLTKHMEIHNPDRPTYKCDACGENFASKGYRRKHMKNTCKSLEYPEWPCDRCGKLFKTKENLHRHRKLHTDGFKFPCKQCPKSFAYLHLLQRHVRNEHERLKDRTEGTKCKFCNQNIVNMDLHILKKHKNTNTYECSTCGKTFKHKQNLKVHENSHLHVKQFRCDTCNRTFAQKGDMNTHIKRIHVDYAKPCLPAMTEKGTRCKICSHVRRDIESHMKFHEKQGLLICSVCNKNFKTKSSLNSHAAHHLKFDQRQWKCDICQYRFTHKSGLRIHIQRRHVFLN